jgi:5-methylcytosine-specific restriction endonuclease McrA
MHQNELGDRRRQILGVTISAPLPALVTSYDVSTEDRLLLRWSLWEAQGKRCYICRDPFDFRHTQVDHIIPRATPPKDFDALWTKFGRGMPNQGVHALENLRACCTDCNSTAVKGRIQFSDETLDTILAKSPGVAKAALSVQRKILRSGDVGKSAIVLASANTPEHYELLWDLDVSQALMAAVHRASQVLQNGRIHPIPEFTAPYQIQLATDGKSARLLAAMHLASGLSPANLAVAVVESAVARLDEEIATAAVQHRNPIFGANAGTTDWSGALFTVSIESVGIEDDVVSYSCRIEFDQNVAVPIAAQSSDGSTLEDTQSDFAVEGYLSIMASTEFGDHVRSAPCVDHLDYVDGEFDIADL